IGDDAVDEVLAAGAIQNQRLREVGRAAVAAQRQVRAGGIQYRSTRTSGIVRKSGDRKIIAVPTGYVKGAIAIQADSIELDHAIATAAVVIDVDRRSDAAITAE